MELGLLWALLAGRQMSRKQRREGRGVPVQQGAVWLQGAVGHMKETGWRSNGAHCGGLRSRAQGCSLYSGGLENRGGVQA